jgi:hypothetical protein
MPADELSDEYAQTYFVRVQMIIRAGGFATFDLG